MFLFLVNLRLLLSSVCGPTACFRFVCSGATAAQVNGFRFGPDGTFVFRSEMTA